LVKHKVMNTNLVTYVNSTMNEFHELGSDLYESMIDMDQKAVNDTVVKLKKMLSEIQKSYHEETNL
jgi:hypothetical protein